MLTTETTDDVHIRVAIADIATRIELCDELAVDGYRIHSHLDCATGRADIVIFDLREPGAQQRLHKLTATAAERQPAVLILVAPGWTGEIPELARATTLTWPSTPGELRRHTRALAAGTAPGQQ